MLPLKSTFKQVDFSDCCVQGQLCNLRLWFLAELAATRALHGGFNDPLGHSHSTTITLLYIWWYSSCE